MRRVIEIIVAASMDDSDLIHRVLHFKEDLHRECGRRHDVTISDPTAIDDALRPVSFTVHSKAGLTSFQKLIKKSLSRHRVEHAVKVDRH